MQNGTMAEVQEVHSAERADRGTITTDRETTAMVKVLRLLDGLTDSERSRVLSYVFAKFGAEN